MTNRKAHNVYLDPDLEVWYSRRTNADERFSPLMNRLLREHLNLEGWTIQDEPEEDNLMVERLPDGTLIRYDPETTTEEELEITRRMHTPFRHYEKT